MEGMESGKLYTLQEVADLTGVKLSNLRYWANRGKIQARKYGRAWMMTGKDIQHFLDHGTMEPDSAEAGEGATA